MASRTSKPKLRCHGVFDFSWRRSFALLCMATGGAISDCSCNLLDYALSWRRRRYLVSGTAKISLMVSVDAALEGSAPHLSSAHPSASAPPAAVRCRDSRSSRSGPLAAFLPGRVEKHPTSMRRLAWLRALADPRSSNRRPDELAGSAITRAFGAARQARRRFQAMWPGSSCQSQRAGRRRPRAAQHQATDPASSRLARW